MAITYTKTKANVFAHASIIMDIQSIKENVKNAKIPIAQIAHLTPKYVDSVQCYMPYSKVNAHVLYNNNIVNCDFKGQIAYTGNLSTICLAELPNDDNPCQ